MGEEVIGTIIGEISVSGYVYYHGRQQGRMLHAKTDRELIVVAKAEIGKLKAEYPMSYTDKEAWELRQ